MKTLKIFTRLYQNMRFCFLGTKKLALIIIEDLHRLLDPCKPIPAYPTVEGFPEITILENDKENPSKIEEWHTDMTFKKNPPLGSILIGKIIPETGGDTMFSSLSKAYDDLSQEWKEKLEEMNAIHSFEFGFKESLEEKGGRERLADALLENPPVTHPVIKQHPVTGKKIIYVNKLFTSHIDGDDSEIQF
jgi:taurine dioxygenase